MYKIFNPKKMFKSRAGYSTGFAFIFGLVSLFGLGIMYIVFSQVFGAHLVPTIKGMVNDTAVTGISEATAAEINGNIDKYMNFFNILPFVLFFAVIVYMFVAAVRKERQSEF